MSHEIFWESALDVCPKCGAPLHLEPGTIASNNGYRKVLRDIPEYDELAAQVLAEFMQELPRIAEGRLSVGMDFQLLMAHCQKYELAHTQADLARVLQLSVATIHEMATS